MVLLGNTTKPWAMFWSKLRSPFSTKWCCELTLQSLGPSWSKLRAPVSTKWCCNTTKPGAMSWSKLMSSVSTQWCCMVTLQSLGPYPGRDAAVHHGCPRPLTGWTGIDLTFKQQSILVDLDLCLDGEWRTSPICSSPSWLTQTSAWMDSGGPHLHAAVHHG